MFLYLFIEFFFFFLAVMGLHYYTWTFSSCSEQGLLFVAVHGLLTAADSLVAEHSLWSMGFSSCGTWA